MGTALVTGGSYGVGRGIVEGLAEAGHDVFFTGRDSAHLAETATRAGGLGGRVFPKVVDHVDDAQVEALFYEVDRHAPLDLLVNTAWGGYENMIEGDRYTWADPYWEQPLWRWDAMITTGVRGAFVASQLATRAMLRRSSGLIVNVSFWAAQKHIANVLYGMAKAATDKMSADMAVEVAGRGISVVSLYPGLVRTEKVMASAAFLDLSNSESPRFIGRVIAALWADPQLADELSGRVVIAAALAHELGITDVDGSSPRPLWLDSA